MTFHSEHSMPDDMPPRIRNLEQKIMHTYHKSINNIYWLASPHRDARIEINRLLSAIFSIQTRTQCKPILFPFVDFSHLTYPNPHILTLSSIIVNALKNSKHKIENETNERTTTKNSAKNQAPIYYYFLKIQTVYVRKWGVPNAMRTWVTYSTMDRNQHVKGIASIQQRLNLFRQRNWIEDSRASLRGEQTRMHVWNILHQKIYEKRGSTHRTVASARRVGTTKLISIGYTIALQMVCAFSKS